MVPNLIIFHVILVLDKVKTCLHCYFVYFINDMESFFVDTGLNVLHLDDNVYDNLIKVL